MSKIQITLKEGGFIVKAKKESRLAAGITFLLIVLTACSGSVDSSLNISSEGFDFQAQEPKIFAEKTFTTELPLFNQLRLRVEAVRGDIEIEGRDDVESITIIARKWVGSNNMEDAEKRLPGLEIQVSDHTDEIVVQTLQPENSPGREYIVDYHIIIPSTLETQLTVISGDIGIVNVRKQIWVDSTNGTVFLSNIAASVEVNLTNGNIDSTMVIPIDGEVRMYVDNGNIDLSIPTTTSAEFAASVTNGSIVTYNLVFETAEQTNKSLTGMLDMGEGVIDISSINGNIAVVGLN